MLILKFIFIIWLVTFCIYGLNKLIFDSGLKRTMLLLWILDLMILCLLAGAIWGGILFKTSL